ncbi:FecCD family ABC transporter permease [Phycicoccus sp. 3266]|uniref:FecCD family ABC transporter permease n=1 Tax=Phycicoccus sp. 3266 TaxID=2817751 RepID=UPI00285685FE|nr:iron complex transport system permease protein [Phycicoccus sp. 3266]
MSVVTVAAPVVRQARIRAQRHTSLVLGGLAVAVVGLFTVNVLLGSYTVTIPDFLRIVSGKTIPGASFILLENKLPQAVLAVLVGAAFGVAGAVFQTLLRNPLASPDVIGISMGASAAAVVGIAFFGVGGLALQGFSMVGSLLAALVIVLVSRRGDLAGHRLILVGIGLAAALQALTSWVLTRTDIHVAAEALVWLNGSLNNATWARVRTLGLLLIVLLPVVAVAARRLPVLELGEEAAVGLGVHPWRGRLLLLLAGTALAAAGTAAAGPVAFVAFLSGPIARRLLRGRATLPVAALVGALVVLAAEFTAVNAVPGSALPVGVVTGLLGGPFLLWLLVTAHRVGRGG